MKNHLRHCFIFFLSLLCCAQSQAELNLDLPEMNLPDIGGSAGHTIAAIKEGDQGLRILRTLRASGQLIEDPEINLWIRSLGNKLASRAPSAATPFYFAVSKNKSINAYATLGGVIVVNAGLVLRSKSESELAAVISHEIAHVTQRHIQRLLAKAKSNQLATGAAMVVGAIAASKDREAGAAILNTTVAATLHKQLSFSREAEAEADRVGLRILASAGFNPQGMPRFLQRMEQFGNSNTAGIREYLQSHPLSIKRVSDTAMRAKQFAAYRGKEDIRYLYMREKLRALTRSGGQARNPQPRIAAYARSLNLQQRNALAQAVQAIAKPNARNVSEALHLAELYHRQRQYQKAVALLRPLIQVYPGNEAITARLAQSLVSLGQTQAAWKYLQDINASEQTSLEIFEIKQEVARLTGNHALAYRAVAERSIRTGRYQAAEAQLQRAIKLPSISAIELQEIQQMLQRIKRFKQLR